MSIDKSLRSRNRLRRFRGVLTRAERIEKLRDEGKWAEGGSIFGLAKVRVRRVRRRAKAAATPEVPAAGEAEAPTEGQAADKKEQEKEKQ